MILRALRFLTPFLAAVVLTPAASHKAMADSYITYDFTYSTLIGAPISISIPDGVLTYDTTGNYVASVTATVIGPQLSLPYNYTSASAANYASFAFTSPSSYSVYLQDPAQHDNEFLSLQSV